MSFGTAKQDSYTLTCFDSASNGSIRAKRPEKETGMSTGSKTTPRGRDAGSGQFTTVKEAKDHPRTHVVERVPKPGYGDTKKK